MLASNREFDVLRHPDLAVVTGAFGYAGGYVAPRSSPPTETATTPCNTICAEDLAAQAVQADSRDGDSVSDAAFPETFTFVELLRQLATAMGVHCRLVQTPPRVGHEGSERGQRARVWPLPDFGAQRRRMMKIASVKEAWACVALLVLYPVLAFLIVGYFDPDNYGVLAALFAANVGTAILVGITLELPELKGKTPIALRLIVLFIGRPAG